MIKNRKEYKHRFHVSWDTKGVREMAKAMELAARISEAGTSTAARISQTYIPQQLNREMRRALPAGAPGALEAGGNGNGHGEDGNGNGPGGEAIFGS
jgi:hypothetical protein